MSLLLLAGLAESVGVVSLLPVLTLGSSTGEGGSESGIESFLYGILEGVGLSPSLGLLLSLIVAGIALKAVLVVLAMRQAGYAAAAVATDLRLDLIRALLTARWSYFASQPAGELANAASNEAERASQVFTFATRMLASAIQVAVYATLAVVTSWEVTLVAALAGVVMVAALNFLVRIARRAGLKNTMMLRSLITRLSDGLAMMKPLKAMAREEGLRRLLESETEAINTSQRQQIVGTATLKAAQEPLMALALAVAVYVLLTRLGVTFDRLIFLAFVFQRTVTHIGSVQSWYQSVTAYESAHTSITGTITEAQRAVEHHTGTVAPTLREGIEFRGVDLHHGERAVLHNVDMWIPAGQITLLVGPSGVGKTTVVDLIAALYEPTAGDILIDGVPLRAIDVRAWRQRIGYIPQELTLLHGTVFDNIALREPHISTSQVEDALKASGAWEFVNRLPDGVHTSVGEHGAKLSGGQRQRIAIARALVRQPAFLVLDEATASLDPATERSIHTTLLGLRGSVTMLAISHQGGLVDEADQTYRLAPTPSGASAELTEPADAIVDN